MLFRKKIESVVPIVDIAARSWINQENYDSSRNNRTMFGKSDDVSKQNARAWRHLDTNPDHWNSVFVSPLPWDRRTKGHVYCTGYWWFLELVQGFSSQEQYCPFILHAPRYISFCFLINRICACFGNFKCYKAGISGVNLIPHQGHWKNRFFLI
jgi:hypothetical protein